MKKALVIAGALIGFAVSARRVCAVPQHVDWEKRFERMPDKAPPKWMFRNISAIRENTDRILDLLQHDRTDQTHPTGAAPIR
jgi:hypothetical protein